MLIGVMVYCSFISFNWFSMLWKYYDNWLNSNILFLFRSSSSSDVRIGGYWLEFPKRLETMVCLCYNCKNILLYHGIPVLAYWHTGIPAYWPYQISCYRCLHRTWDRPHAPGAQKKKKKITLHHSIFKTIAWNSIKKRNFDKK